MKLEKAEEYIERLREAGYNDPDFLNALQQCLLADVPNEQIAVLILETIKKRYGAQNKETNS